MPFKFKETGLRPTRRTALSVLVALVILGAGSMPTAYATPARVIILRHGDKDPANERNHNLSAAGLQRALRLPDILLGRYGQPAFIFAPQPKAPNGANIRAIQTISPTAIQAGINIDTRFAVGQEAGLAQALLKDPRYDGQQVFVCWEHKAINDIARDLGVASTLKKWKGSDYGTLYVISFAHDTPTLTIDQQ